MDDKQDEQMRFAMMNFKPSPHVSANIETIRVHLEEITGGPATRQDAVRFALAFTCKALKARKAQK